MAIHNVNTPTFEFQNTLDVHVPSYTHNVMLHTFSEAVLFFLSKATAAAAAGDSAVSNKTYIF